MARKPSQFAGFRKISGPQSGRIAKKVYVCKSCGIHHKTQKKPLECMDRSCGGLIFTKFDSVGEVGRWATLCLLEKAGEISNLKRQVSFDLMAARQLQGRTVQVKVARYIADYTYTKNGENIIEDFKGGLTDVATIKLKWMEAMGLPVKLTT